MNERDKELADEAEAYADRDFKGEINWGEAYESKLIALIRADEREACASVVDKRLKFWATSVGKDKAYKWLKNLSEVIRARENT